MEPTRRPARDPGTTWAKPVDRLSMGQVPDDAVNLNVTGRRLSGPLQGFGQLWQKTYRIRFEGAAPDPSEVVAIWKREFGSFWPAGQRFYAPAVPAVSRMTGREEGAIRGIRMELREDDGSDEFTRVYERVSREGAFEAEE